MWSLRWRTQQARNSADFINKLMRLARHNDFVEVAYNEFEGNYDPYLVQYVLHNAKKYNEDLYVIATSDGALQPYCIHAPKKSSFDGKNVLFLTDGKLAGLADAPTEFSMFAEKSVLRLNAEYMYGGFSTIPVLERSGCLNCCELQGTPSVRLSVGPFFQCFLSFGGFAVSFVQHFRVARHSGEGLANTVASQAVIQA